ncbi:hypothetical protein Q426_05835 [Streptococcus equi subsp. zooepidemicus CY]|nr:hypothetical protein Q426_05835 [Streptococcus equi subsp. zooepidemicus CY]
MEMIEPVNPKEKLEGHSSFSFLSNDQPCFN